MRAFRGDVVLTMLGAKPRYARAEAKSRPQECLAHGSSIYIRRRSISTKGARLVRREHADQRTVARYRGPRRQDLARQGQGLAAAAVRGRLRRAGMAQGIRRAGVGSGAAI